MSQCSDVFWASVGGHSVRAFVAGDWFYRNEVATDMRQPIVQLGVMRLTVEEATALGTVLTAAAAAALRAFEARDPTPPPRPALEEP